MSKQYVEYKIGDEVVYVEAVPLNTSEEQNIANDDIEVIEGGNFDKVISGLKPIANAVFSSLNGLNKPSEIQLEMGVKLGTKAGIILASADSEVTFKVNVKWTNS